MSDIDLPARPDAGAAPPRRGQVAGLHPLVEAAARQPMMLGLFLPIHNGGWTMSTAPRATDWTFEYNAALTRMAEDIGFELVFGPLNWLPKGGFGGVTRYRETSLDSFLAAVALAPLTQRILLISTVHILHGPLHPMHVAKFGATADHISGGRWGFNMVTGFLSSERPMFGQAPIEHDLRYDMAAEYTDLLLRLWESDENVDFHGRHWKVEHAFITPKPKYGRPVIVNATGSPAGMDYAARYSDIVFVTSPAGAEIEATLQALPVHVERARAAARRYGRDIKLLINPLVLCRDTDEEAWQAYEQILAQADDEALDGFFQGFAQSDSKSWARHERNQRAVGGNIQLVGSPASIVQQIARLKQVGIDGLQICFFDYVPELQYFSDKVMPLLREAGLRL